MDEGGSWIGAFVEESLPRALAEVILQNSNTPDPDKPDLSSLDPTNPDPDKPELINLDPDNLELINLDPDNLELINLDPANPELIIPDPDPDCPDSSALSESRTELWEQSL